MLAEALCVSSELPMWQHGESPTPRVRANLGTDAFPSEAASGPVARFVALVMCEVRQCIAETWERIISSPRCGMPFLGIPLLARGPTGDKLGLYVPFRGQATAEPQDRTYGCLQGHAQIYADSCQLRPRREDPNAQGRRRQQQERLFPSSTSSQHPCHGLLRFQ